MVSRRQAIREGYLKSTALTVVERACTLLMQATEPFNFYNRRVDATGVHPMSEQTQRPFG